MEPNQPLIHSSTHPLIHSSTHPLIHSSTHPLVRYSHSLGHCATQSIAVPCGPPAAPAASSAAAGSSTLLGSSPPSHPNPSLSSSQDSGLDYGPLRRAYPVPAPDSTTDAATAASATIEVEIEPDVQAALEAELREVRELTGLQLYVLAARAKARSKDRSDGSPSTPAAAIAASPRLQSPSAAREEMPEDGGEEGQEEAPELRRVDLDLDLEPAAEVRAHSA